MTPPAQDAYDQGYRHGYYAERPRYAGAIDHLKTYIEGYLDGEAQALDDDCCDFRWETVMESFA